VARRIQIPPAILLVVAGLLLAFVPGLPALELAPPLILLVILPPVVYWSAVSMSWREFRFNLRPISLLAIGCVAFTTAATAAGAHYFLGFPWGVGFVLGAIVSPPDEVAPLAIARRLCLPGRLQVILEGEGLANDATSLVLYRFAIAAVGAGLFSLAQASAEFAAILVGEILWGIAVGWIMLRLRHNAHDPHVEILLSVLTPFAAYWPPQQLGGSGVLAAVAAGLYVSWYGPYLISSATRLQGIFFWDFLNYLIEGMVFLVTGLQARGLIARMSTVPMSELLIAAGIVCATVILARFVWMFPSIYLPRWLVPSIRRGEDAVPWQAAFILAFTGIRGLVSLAIALAIPFSTETGQPFPYRDEILFLTFAVILVTLVGQGLTLPALIRLLGLANTGIDERREERVQERAARHKAVEAALAKLAAIENESKLSGAFFERLRARYRERLQQLAHRAENPGAIARYDEIEDQLIATERGTVNALYRQNKLSDESRRRIEHELDLREAQLTKLREGDEL
jgi:CPA1 family monovalent cation:H+ antiporter